MADDPGIGYGSLYEIFYGGVYTAVSHAFNIAPGQEQADRVDVTHYQSPGRRRQHIGGMIDVGTGTVEFNLTPNNDTHQMLRALKASGDTVNHRITFPDGETVVYPAVVTGVSFDLPIDDRKVGRFTFEVNGDETWTS